MKSWSAKILTSFPEMFPGTLAFSLAGKALAKGIWNLELEDIKDSAANKSYSVDDLPYGGGPGMVMRPDVLAKSYDKLLSRMSFTTKNYAKVLLSPRGKSFNQNLAKKFAELDGIILVCGRYEGVDQRFVEARGLEEISVGDYVLSGGEPAAIVLIDSVVRLLSGVIGSSESLNKESFEDGLLEYPQYTRPHNWENHRVPEVLTSGNHDEIAKWRIEKSKSETKERRPDLWKVWKAIN